MSARAPARGAVEFAACAAPDSNKGSVRTAVASNLKFRRAFIRLSNLLVVNDLEAWCFLAHAHASNIGQMRPAALFLSKSTTKLLSRAYAQRAQQKEMAYGAGDWPADPNKLRGGRGSEEAMVLAAGGPALATPAGVSIS